MPQDTKHTIETFESFGAQRSKPEPVAATMAASAPPPIKQQEKKQEVKAKEPETTIDFFSGELVEVTEIEQFQQEEKKSSPVRVSMGKSRPSRYAAESETEEEIV